MPLARALLALALAVPAAVTADEAPREVTLEQALGQLDLQNLDLAEARGRVEEAAGSARQARGAALPTLFAAGSFVRNSDEAVARFGTLLGSVLPPGVPRPADLVIQPGEAFTGSVTLRVPLFAPAVWAAAAAAGHGVRARDASLAAARQQLRAALRQAAFAAWAAEEVVGAAGRALQVAEEQARLAERALAAGTGVPLSVLQARTEAVRRRSDLARARADRGRASLAVGVLLGRAEPVRIPMERPAAPALDVPTLTQEALARREEVRATVEAERGAEQQLASARWQLAPLVSASASAFAQNVPFPTGRDNGWRATVDLIWFVYDGERHGKAAEAEGSVAVARAAREGQRLAIAQEVDDAAREVTVAVERLALAEEQARLAGEAAATARRGFAGGVASSLDVLDANDRLFQSEVGLAGARAQLGIAVAALDRATGRG